MAIKPLLVVLRSLFLIACSLSIFAFAVEWSVHNPDGAVQKIILGMADAPRLAATTFTNVTSDRFALSRTPDEFSTLKSYRPIPNRSGHDIDGLVMRTDGATPPLSGWRVLYGIFRIDGEPAYAALALSPSLAIEHVWLLNGKVSGEAITPFEPAPYPHGFALLKDGSIIAGFDTNYRTVRIGPCGALMWTSPASLNHAITAMEDDHLAWGVGGYDRVQSIDLRTGAIQRTITMEALRRANPDVSALDMLRIDDNGLGENARSSAERSYADPYHPNDAEPLPPELATQFPQFRAGDLLLSFRSLNMIAVVDPRTLTIKWFNNDTLFRQHDPDWEPDGRISVLDNQMGRAFSRIISFDPRTNQHHTVLNGKQVNFYTRIRGKHQSLSNGGLSVTSPGQGRVFELDRDGGIALEILNRDTQARGRNFLISEAITFPANYPSFEKVRACKR